LPVNGGSAALVDIFPERARPRAPMPGNHATIPISLKYDTAKQVDDI
jgi:PhnB protein